MHTGSAAACVLAILLQGNVASLVGGTSPSSWPQFRGPQGSGLADPDEPAPVEFGPETNVLWKADLSRGHSSPCIVGDRIFLTGFDPGKRDLETLSLDRATGTVVWRCAVHPETIETVHELSSPATATPVSDGKAVYVYFGSFGLLAYDFGGHERWRKPLPMAIVPLGFGSGTSPIVAEGLVILDLHLKENSHLLAVRCRDGETAWTAPKPKFNSGFSTPVVWSEDQEAVVGILNGGRFTAHNLKDGSERWWIEGLPRLACAIPAVANGLLVLNATGPLDDEATTSLPTTLDDVLVHYDAKKTGLDGLISKERLPDARLFADRKTTAGVGNLILGPSPRLGRQENGVSPGCREWKKAWPELTETNRGEFMKSGVWAIRLGGSGDVSSTQVLWKDPRGVPEVPSPLLYGNRLYLVRNGGILSCREAATGRVLFEERLDAAGGYYASPVCADGKIYTASDRGLVVVSEAKDEFRVLARNDFKEPIMATPALVEGKLYVRTATHIYALGRNR